MSIVKNELRRRDNIIATVSAERDHARGERDHAHARIAAMEKEIAELRNKRNQPFKMM